MKPILIAEHDKIVANTLHNLIKEKIGCECLIANNSNETVTLLKKYNGKFELIILDLELPDSPDGGWVDPILKLNIPLILFTTNTEDEEKYRQKDIADYIVKTGPFSIYHALNVAEQITRNKHINVLVVDPCVDETKKITNLLKTNKLNIIAVPSAEDALEIIDKSHIHLVITEFKLSQMSGIKFIRTLREKYNRNQMAIIVISDDHEKYIPPKCFKSGANDFIYKGYDREEFYARLNVHLEMIGLFDTIKTESLEKANKEKLLLEDSKMNMIGDLLYNISHHWRQPLMSISTTIGSLRVMKEYGTADLDKELESLDSITDLTQEMSNTIEMFKDFFSFAKEKEEFDILAVINDYYNLISTALDEQKIQLEIQGDKEIKYEGNKENFVHALINNINNAKEAVSKQTNDDKLILIKISHDIKNGVEINICDSGGGVLDEINTKIFEPYFSTKEDRNGTGLGLFIARKFIVNDFKGTIGVKNIEFEHNGKEYYGADFKINLPLN